MRAGLLRVSSRRWCAGAVVEVGFVVRVAPIMRWALGKRAEKLSNWARGKGMQVEWFPDKVAR